MFVYPSPKVKETGGLGSAQGPEYSPHMAKHPQTTEELQRSQRERTTDEHDAIGKSITPDEASQHRRRAAKSAYLERRLAERERSERKQRRD
jgi:hypothetical protein